MTDFATLVGVTNDLERVHAKLVRETERLQAGLGYGHDLTWSDYFQPTELECRCGCGKGAESMDERFLHALAVLRKECDFPFVLNSAYRCPKHNAKVSGTGRNGPHTIGAVDIRVPDTQHALKIIANAQAAGMTGIGYAPRKRFVHVDALRDGDGGRKKWPRPGYWTY